MPYTVAELNQLNQSQFVEILGAVFEHTPAIAAQAWEKRPFRSVEDLHQAMLEVMNGLTDDEKMRLICAHPDLGSKAKMAEASVEEQKSAGLNALTQAESDRIESLNRRYSETFGFPFIIAVKNYTKSGIFAEFENRLQNDAIAERERALQEIAAIAGFRLLAIVSSS